ncbi:MAG TPA: chemotaxis protein CheW [Gemmatimonadales bacterium]|nr:chemotaxis protein CheW [Gemmatimonadales bacterium]
MSGGAGHLLVRAGGRLVGLPLTQVVEVLDPGAAFPVPSVEPAVRGVSVIRGRILPVVHLGALLEGRPCPTERSELGVLVELGGRRLCLEIEEAESVLYERGMPVQAGSALPWAAGVARTPQGLIPLLDLAALGARFTETSAA